MKKYILGTHEGKPLTPHVVSLLQKNECKIIQTKSWPEAVKMCQNITFDIIIGYCDSDTAAIDRFLGTINDNYLRNNKSGASIILQPHKQTLRSDQFPSLNNHLKKILPSSISKANLMSIIVDLL